MTYTASANLDSLIADRGIQTLLLLCTVTWETNALPSVSFIWTILDINPRTWWNRAQPDSLYWLCVCRLDGQPSLSSSGTDTLRWWRLTALSQVDAGLCPSASTGASGMMGTCSSCSPGRRAAGSVATPGQRGHLPPSSAPGLGCRGWHGVPASQGLVKTELPNQCVCGLACVSWDPLTGYLTPFLLGMGLRRHLPSCQVCFLCLLVFLISSWYGATCFVLWTPTEAELYLAMFPYKRSVLLGNVGCTASSELHG